MKIYFCDVCNESIPQDDLEKNRVTTVKGKMICAKCVPPAAVAATAASAPAGTVTPVMAASAGAGGAIALLVAIALGGLGTFFALQAKNRLDVAPDLAPRLEDVTRTCDRLLEDVSAQNKRLDAIAASITKIEGDVAANREGGAEQLARLEKVERSLLDAKSQFDLVRSGRDHVEQLEVSQKKLDHDLEELKAAMSDVRKNMKTLAAAPAPTEPGAPTPEAPKKEEGPQFDAETKKLIADLTNKDPSARWSAVDRLAKKRDVRLIPSLLPLLEDSDAFVQFRVISTLRELNARSAVSRLIKLLRDGDAIVRGEALDALVTLTGNPQRFDVESGPPAEREKGVKGWEEWYEKNKSRFQEDAAPAAVGG
jgi:hypothetical protein